MVVEAAAEAIGKLGSAAFGPLVEAMLDPKYRYRAQTLAAKAPRAVGRCAWRGARSFVFWKRVTMMKRVKPPRRWESLVMRARLSRSSMPCADKESRVRHAAAEGLGKLRDARSVGPLINALGDGDQHVRKAIGESLAILGQPKWKTMVVGDAEDWRRLATCAEPVAIPALIGCLTYGNQASCGGGAANDPNWRNQTGIAHGEMGAGGDVGEAAPFRLSL